MDFSTIVAIVSVVANIVMVILVRRVANKTLDDVQRSLRQATSLQERIGELLVESKEIITRTKELIDRTELHTSKRPVNKKLN